MANASPISSRKTWPSLKPRALRMPISRVRSRALIIIVLAATSSIVSTMALPTERSSNWKLPIMPMNCRLKAFSVMVRVS